MFTYINQPHLHAFSYQLVSFTYNYAFHYINNPFQDYIYLFSKGNLIRFAHIYEYWIIEYLYTSHLTEHPLNLSDITTYCPPSSEQSSVQRCRSQVFTGSQQFFKNLKYPYFHLSLNLCRLKDHRISKYYVKSQEFS